MEIEDNRKEEIKIWFSNQRNYWLHKGLMWLSQQKCSITTWKD